MDRRANPSGEHPLPNPPVDSLEVLRNEIRELRKERAELLNTISELNEALEVAYENR